MQKTIYFLIAIFLLLGQSSSGQTHNESQPKLHATLAGMSGGEVTMNQLLNDSVFAVSEPGFKIISFRMSAYAQGLTPIEIDTKGNRLTDSMHAGISRLKKGCKIYFEYIKAVHIAGDNNIFMVAPIAFKIK
jgi:hypothetical protein